MGRDVETNSVVRGRVRVSQKAPEGVDRQTNRQTDTRSHRSVHYIYYEISYKKYIQNKSNKQKENTFPFITVQQ